MIGLMPKEINRRTTMHRYSFTTEHSTINNGINEGIPEEKFILLNCMIDLLFGFITFARKKLLEKIWIRGDYILVTLHRPSNVDM